MSIRRLSILIFVFLPFMLMAQVKYFEIKPIAAPTQFSINVDHPDCGQIVVYSSLPRLIFESNMAGIQETKYSALDSKYVIFLKPVRQKVVVKSHGFIEAELWGPGTPRAKDVVEYYSIEERNPDPSKVNVFSVSFKISPSDATLKVDNRERDASKPVMLEPRSYELEVSKSGFITERKQITVSAERAFFEVNLKAQDLVMLTIRSTPSEADVSLDSVAEGRTNRQIFRFPGSYRLRLAKAGYETIEEEINVKESGDNTFDYSLSKATVSLSISLDPPDATLLINNEAVSGTSFELAPGQYKLEARKSGYDPLEKRIELKKNESSSQSLVLFRQSGRLVFTIDPMEANLSLSDGSKWTGARIMPLPVGEYSLSASLKDYQTLKQSFKIEKDKDTKLDLELLRLGGTRKEQIKPVSEDLLAQQKRWKRHQTYSLVSLVATVGASAFMYYRADAAYDDYKAADSAASAQDTRQQFLKSRDQYYLSAGVNLIPLTYTTYSFIKRQIVRSRIKEASK